MLVSSDLFVLANFIGRSLLLNPGEDDVVVEVGGYKLDWSSEKVCYSDPSGKILFCALEDGDSFVVQEANGKQETFEKGNIPVRLTTYFQSLGLPGSDWPFLVNAEDIPSPIEAEPVPEEDMHLFEEIEVEEQEFEEASDKVVDPFRLMVLRQPKPTSEVS